MDLSSFCVLVREPHPGSRRSNKAMGGKKAMKKFLRKAAAYGFTWELSRGGHILIRHCDIEGTYTASHTPMNEGHWVKQTRSGLNRIFGIRVS